MNPIDNFEIRQKIIELANKNPGEEIGGVIYKNDLIHLPNLAQNPGKEFAVYIGDYLDCQAVWHTHTIEGRDGFSIEDIKACRWKKIPYLLYTAHQTWHYYDPSEIKPLLGRQWDWVHQNCFNLLQDWVLQTFNYKMDDFYLSSEFAWQTEDVGYVENLPSQGFRRIDISNLQENDIILMYDRTNHPNHVGIFIDGVKNLMLHHLSGQLSQHSIYGSHWRKITHSVWRFTG